MNVRFKYVCTQTMCMTVRAGARARSTSNSRAQLGTSSPHSTAPAILVLKSYNEISCNEISPTPEQNEISPPQTHELPQMHNTHALLRIGHTADMGVLWRRCDAPSPVGTRGPVERS